MSCSTCTNNEAYSGIDLIRDAASGEISVLHPTNHPTFWKYTKVWMRYHIQQNSRQALYRSFDPETLPNSLATLSLISWQTRRARSIRMAVKPVWQMLVRFVYCGRGRLVVFRSSVGPLNFVVCSRWC